MYLAAIAAGHVGFEGKTANQHSLVCHFMKGTHRVLPVSRPLASPWDLAVVLDGLSGPLFEPLEEVDMKHLYLKTVLLLALVSSRSVTFMHSLWTLRVLSLLKGHVRVSLKPNPSFVSKVVGSCSPVDLMAFSLPPCPSLKRGCTCCVQSAYLYGQGRGVL